MKRPIVFFGILGGFQVAMTVMRFFPRDLSTASFIIADVSAIIGFCIFGYLLAVIAEAVTKISIR